MPEEKILKAQIAEQKILLYEKTRRASSASFRVAEHHVAHRTGAHAKAMAHWETRLAEYREARERRGEIFPPPPQGTQAPARRIADHPQSCARGSIPTTSSWRALLPPPEQRQQHFLNKKAAKKFAAFFVPGFSEDSFERSMTRSRRRETGGSSKEGRSPHRPPGAATIHGMSPKSVARRKAPYERCTRLHINKPPL